MQSPNYYLQKLAGAKSQLNTILIEASHSLNTFYLEPESWTLAAKADESPVTTADHYCHDYLCSQLAQLGFEIPIISEENSDEEMAAFCIDPPDVYWLIDPLDGTSGFVKGTGHFAVNVALIYNKVPLAGWIAWPRTGLLCWAFGINSFDAGSLNFQVTEPESLQEIAALKKPDNTIIFSSSSQNRRKRRVMAAVLPVLDNPQVYSLGAAVKFCAMFQGYGDFYPRLAGTCLWDLAAGQVLLRARGGDIFCLDGRPMEYDFRRGVINPFFLAVTDAQSPQLPLVLEKLREVLQTLGEEL